ncbi:putative thioredoxin [Gonapodya prolifera JEL478]|uniref:Putative thioredoxin n=1 Tax=Gonapodya prolifera (strain JEL478) TaxID=1344416 RepID=A0A139AW91_GONPJ|nr:putative thioredoxin [Gonapodya prolifera JEL478]|eukprot:KXS20988.1 putative thioredoxin [Gonapodya prolifera JEL478]
MPPRAISIDIVSDTICPWCFIGKRRLEKAFSIVNRPEVQYNITWHPFQLDPTLPSEGISKRESYIRKFGKERIEKMIPQMQATGRADGVEFSYDGLIANTIDSHRLINYVQNKLQDKEKTNALMEELFKDYFERSKNIGDRNVLSDAASRVGLDRTQIMEYLSSDVDREQTITECSSWSRRGVTGVPYFLFEKKYALSGAQPPDLLAELIEEVLDKNT